MIKKQTDSNSGLREELEKLNKTLTSLTNDWRFNISSKDLQLFFDALNQIEKIIAFHADVHDTQVIKNHEEMLKMLNDLHMLMKNQDLIGMADLVEYQLIPFIREWKEVVKNNGL